MRIVTGFLLLVSMSHADIERAVALARWPHSDSERSAFHARYVKTFQFPAALAGPAVESIEIVTAFRRLELIAEAHEKLHDMWARGGALQEAEAALEPWRGGVSAVAHVRYGLLTIGVPDVAVTLSGGASLEPVTTKTTSVATGDTIVGGDIDARFDAVVVGQNTWTVIVRSNGAEIGRATFDFGAIE
jgi:hypothetical protein